MQLAEWLENRIVEGRFGGDFGPLRPLEDRIITLSEGLKKLALLDARMRAEQMIATPGRPFLFMAGAGISNPPVLLASEIIKECMAKAGRATESVDYATALGIAYPNEDQRQGYFMQLIAGKYVSNGNFRLAHLLTAKKNDKCFSNVVVTTNFDDFFTRALTIFGDVPRVYHSAQVLKGKTLGGGSDIEIYHVHGSFLSYDIANLNTEVSQRAKEWRDVLSRLLPAVTPIVVGYAGQDSGAFMVALRSFLESEPPLAGSQQSAKDAEIEPRVFWFCYRQVDLERLPPWLLKNEAVVFITPDIAPTEAPDQLRDFFGARRHITKKLASRTHCLARRCLMQ